MNNGTINSISLQFQAETDDRVNKSFGKPQRPKSENFENNSFARRMEYFAPMKNARVNDFKNISSSSSDQGIKDNVKCSGIVIGDNVANDGTDTSSDITGDAITVNITDHSDDKTDKTVQQLQHSGNMR